MTKNTFVNSVLCRFTKNDCENMKDKLIERFKNQRKRRYIETKSKKKYAFVGIGGHSTANLYPILDYFRVNLKYIVTKNENSANLIDANFEHSIGTNSLDMVLEDTEVAGVFISAAPTSHYSLVERCLKAGKSVFVEKPPCLTTSELQQLISVEATSLGSCVVGLQKQYAPLYSKLKGELKKGVCSYNYSYLTGSYVEGDAFYDLFIHPLSVLFYLFGNIEKVNVMRTKQNGSSTVFLQLQHRNGVVGAVELSTNYSWQTPIEKMIVNSPKGVFETENMVSLYFSPKQGTIFGIPKEKILKLPHSTTTLYQALDFVPTLENNQLYSAGYFSEIETFLHLTEKLKQINNSTLTSCLATYQLIDKIKNS